MKFYRHIPIVLLTISPYFFLNDSIANELKPFHSDGCSLFPDSNLITHEHWCECCFEHDVVYWRGGSEIERAKADTDLKVCISVKTKNTLLAETMYNGVRFGGSPYFYNWYRWGYGWSENRKYQPLTEADIKLADSLLSQYYFEQKRAACPSS